ncbi:MAG: EamA family transporter [Deltaproteobacteria bacterium]|nr:EamA family transporter [Deltaproteobacteria bacterium]
MTLTVLALVVLASALHVSWNTLVKKCKNKASFTWLTTLASTLILLPVFLIYRWSSSIDFDFRILPWAALSGFFEAWYFIFLYSAYRRTDLSVVYPLSRGAAPVLTLLLAGTLVGDHVTFDKGLAVMVVTLGIVSVGLSIQQSGQGPGWAGALLSLGSGLMIASYHLVDRKAMLRPNPLVVWEYMFLMQLFLSIFMSAWGCLDRTRVEGLRYEWRENRLGVLAVSFLAPLAYGLIVLALKLGNVTYVTAGRNVGIVMSVIVGIIYFKEKVSGPRVLGAALITIGVAWMVIS